MRTNFWYQPAQVALQKNHKTNVVNIMNNKGSKMISITGSSAAVLKLFAIICTNRVEDYHLTNNKWLTYQDLSSARCQRTHQTN